MNTIRMLACQYLVKHCFPFAFALPLVFLSPNSKLRHSTRIQNPAGILPFIATTGGMYSIEIFTSPLATLSKDGEVTSTLMTLDTLVVISAAWHRFPGSFLMLIVGLHSMGFVLLHPDELSMNLALMGEHEHEDFCFIPEQHLSS